MCSGRFVFESLPYSGTTGYKKADTIVKAAKRESEQVMLEKVSV